MIETWYIESVPKPTKGLSPKVLYTTLSPTLNLWYVENPIVDWLLDCPMITVPIPAVIDPIPVESKETWWGTETNLASATAPDPFPPVILINGVSR